MAIQNISICFSKPHPHAELMMQYAQDAMETDKPWERWQFADGYDWHPLTSNPMWGASAKYRRKPKPYEPTLLDQSLELEIESMLLRMKHYTDSGNHGFAELSKSLADEKRSLRSPEMIEHLRAQGKL